MPNENHHSHEKSRGKSQDPPRSKSRGRGGGGGTQVVTKTSVSTGGGRGRQGKGNGGEQHHEQHHNAQKPKTIPELEKELAEKKAKAKSDREKQKLHNEEIESRFEKAMLKRMELDQDLLDKYNVKQRDIQNTYDAKKKKDGYDEMDEETKKEYTKDMKRNIRKRWKQFFQEQEVFAVPTRRHTANLYYTEEKQKKHAEKKDKAEHKGDHMPKSNPKSAELHVIPGGPSDDATQMRYDPALWGAATHTRARDSLRYL